MHAIDWLLAIVPVLFVIACATYTRRYIKGVADFVAGGRAAGRYIICNAKGEASTGVANTLSKFQPLIVSGFVLSWWDAVSVPVIMVVAISGFVIYRYRQTRAMTIGQFFEMRYSRRFRLFAGMVGFIAGLLNYGIFPAVSSNFFVYFLDLPTHFSIGPLHLPTNVAIMAAYLSCTVWMMTVGGQIALLVTDCVEGILSHLIWVIVVVAIFCTISWSQMRATVSSAPPGHSLINPFDQMKTKDFNVEYALMTLAITIYGIMTIQKDNGFASAARSPHEARMGGVLGWWRTMARTVMLVVLAIGALTFMNQSNFPGHAAISAIGDDQLRSQMQVPIALRYLLPVGVKGLFCTIMVLGLVSGDASHMLTWGGVFIQDVVLPLRKGPMTPEQHVRLLRLSVIGVALFAFCFSIFFIQKMDIIMWWAATEGVFACGAGAAIIGGLYWKKGTTTGVWCGFSTGTLVTLLGLAAINLIPNFPINGRQLTFIAAASAVAVYIAVSLLTCRGDFNMDRMLHRGKYSASGEGETQTTRLSWRQRLRISHLLGFDSDFTYWDKIVSGGIFFWSIFWLFVVLVGTTWNLLRPWPNEVWASYWFVAGIVLPLIVTVGTLIWFGIGGVLDLRNFFARLATTRRDSTDDGRVGPEEGGTQRP